MSRSIHTTRKSLAALRSRRFTDEKERTEAISEAETELTRKRRIKWLVAEERRRPTLPAGIRTSPTSVAVTIRDLHPHVYHAVSESDVRAVMDALPATAVHGINEIRLCLGSKYIAERREDLGGEPDPYTGRLGSAHFPGVYSGTVLGTYFPARGLITIYAYVVDRTRSPVPWTIGELYLRLLALKTLVHEVAHFHDRTARVKRGRWLADRHENLEWYAEKMEHQWTTDVVAPYLERTYARECRLFESWVEQRGGIRLPLRFFAGDSRRTERDGLTRLVFSTSGAFDCWIERLPRCASARDAHFALARELHYADCYNECLTILDRILKNDTADTVARGFRADTLVHLDRLDEALADADSVIAADPTETDGWIARSDVLECRKQWSALLETCERWSGTRHGNGRHRRECYRYLAIACCALDDLQRMEDCLSAYWRMFRFKDPEVAKRRALWMRRAIFRRAGKPLADDPMRKFVS
jgi:hypothetical protein